MFKQLLTKTILLIISILSVLAISCKKEHNIKIQPGQKTYTVRFKVDGFSQSNGPFKTHSVRTNSVTADFQVSKNHSVFNRSKFWNNNRFF
jgi:hypothetical protein